MRKTTIVLAIFVSITALFPATIEELLEKGDEYKEQGKLEMAKEKYLAAYVIDSTDFDVLQKLARCYIDIGELRKDEKEQKDHYITAEKYAREAVTLYPNEAESHFLIVYAIGRHTLLESPKKQIKLSKEIRVEIEKTLSLDPKHDGAYHAYGKWHAKMAEIVGMKRIMGALLGGIPKGSYDEAVKYFKKAIEIKPEHISHHLELGKTYATMQQWQNARDELNLCLSLPQSDIDDQKHKEEAKRLFLEIEDKN